MKMSSGPANREGVGVLGGIREEAIRPFARPSRVGVAVWVGTLQHLNMFDFGKENDATGFAMRHIQLM